MNKSEEKFKNIYDEFFEKIIKFAYYKLGIYQDAEDIAEETFTAIWKSINKIDEDKNIKGLVYQIAQNKINDLLRTKYKRNNWSVVVEEEYLENIAEDKNKSFRTEFWKVLNKLKGFLNERELIFYDLRYVQNQKLKYIAEAMQITVNNAKVINNRLVNKIKKIWEEMNGK